MSDLDKRSGIERRSGKDRRSGYDRRLEEQKQAYKELERDLELKNAELDKIKNEIRHMNCRIFGS